MLELLGPEDTFKVTTWYRALYVDTDRLGVVNNGHYFRFFEQARGEYLRELGLPYSEVEARGIFTPLTEAWAHYYASFHYDDLIRIEAWVSQVKKASFRFDYRLHLEDSLETRVAGHTIHATVDKDLKVTKIPTWLFDLLKTAPKNPTKAS
ncbi:MAG: acyl-CoA thioesterase [Deltaproteobacteria bacterium]|jgi:acyl-CoA thioester hydrolase|nr:acyl-CoA thioesterase [Deltaproteobacteria bacterium]